MEFLIQCGSKEASIEAVSFHSAALGFIRETIESSHVPVKLGKVVLVKGNPEDKYFDTKTLLRELGIKQGVIVLQDEKQN